MRSVRRRKVAYVVVGLFVSAVAINAQGNKSQTKPNLSGTWMLDQSRSNVGTSSNAAASNYEIKIAHSEPELRIRRTTNVNGQIEERELTYYTDGRGEMNPTIAWLSSSPDSKSPKSANTKSRTRWSGDKVVTRSMLSLSAGSQIVQYDLIEEWKLSADGKTLTQTTRFVFQQNPMDRSIYIPANRPDDRRVYNLVSK